MAKDKSSDIAKREAEKIKTSAEINESYFVGLLWSNPHVYYGDYADTMSEDEFIHPVWAFYFDLGRRLYMEGIQKFDDITVHTKVKEYNINDDFQKFGKMVTIDDSVNIVKEYSENIEYYFETIKKNYTIRQLYLLFGNKVFINKGKYNWNNMTRGQLSSFWGDKVNKLSLDSVTRYEDENLYIDPDEFIRKLEEDSSEMLPFYNSLLMNTITQGVERGSVYMWGGFGNTGKSSIMADKFVMSCIDNKEKLILVLNEEDAQSFRQKIVLSILNHEFNKGFDRKRMVNGKLKDSDKDLIRKAFAKMKELMNGAEAQIKVIFMERYVISDLEKIVRFWSNRGYHNLVIDTHKVSDDSKHDKRWETFVEDMKTIYRMTRKNAGGLNLRTWVNFQLADSAIKNRYLDFTAMAEGRGAKNEASTVQMFRPAWQDEYEGGNNELECYRLHRRDDGTFDREDFTLKKGKTYYLVFTPKNRTGSNNDNGQPILILEPAFHKNAFYEKGWTFVAKDYQ